MVEIFEILTKDFPFVKKKYNKLCYCHDYTTICSALIIGTRKMGFEEKAVWRKKLAEKTWKFKPESLSDPF